MLNQSNNIFIVGIKGVAMANLALILKKMGKNVMGSDVAEEFITDGLLEKNKIRWQEGFNKLPDKIDLVIYSAAHGGTANPQVLEAKKKGVKIISQAEILGEIMDKFKTKIAVCGSHGKTTTSSLLAYSLIKLGEKPSYLVGAPNFNDFLGGDYQINEHFVVEADEYGVNPPSNKTPKFNFLNPDYIICTNIDFDHPDVYMNIDETRRAFTKFFDDKKLILNIDDTNILQCLERLNSTKFITYGFSKKADYQITNWEVKEDGSKFDLRYHPRGKSELFPDYSLFSPFHNDNLTDFKISLFGKHNISNATAVIVQLLLLGYEAKAIKKAISYFKGAKRRFEVVYKKNGNYLLDDYAHHPREIEATIKAARMRFPKRKIIVIFQPHTYSRTLSLLKDFAQSLSYADKSFILPIFPSAREKAINFNITSEAIARHNPTKLLYVPSKNHLLKILPSFLQSHEIIFTMGAGDVYKLKDEIIKIVKNSIFKVQSFNSKLKIEENKDLFSYLTIRVHVQAEYFVEATSRQELIEAKKLSDKLGIPLFLLGGGSNLAPLKTQISGLVVHNRYIKKQILIEAKDFVDLLVSSGYPVSRLVTETIEAGWEGFEYHKGLPGTVGGAIYMNSKWTHPPSYFGDNLLYAYLVDENGKVKRVDKKYFQFAYDYSILQNTGEIVLEAIFRLKKTDPLILKKRADEALNYRKKTQPFGVATSGCFFKNIKGLSAGYLIDKAGLKGFSVGDWIISDIHANFVINKRDGKPEDLRKLLQIVKQQVKDKFGVELEEEVITI